MKPIKPFIDVVERQPIVLGGRFREPEVSPVRTYTPEQIAHLKLAPPPEEESPVVRRVRNMAVTTGGGER